MAISDVKVDKKDLGLLKSPQIIRVKDNEYCTIKVKINGKRTTKMLHLFITECTSRERVQFLDGDTLNCHRANMEKVPKMNERDTPKIPWTNLQTLTPKPTGGVLGKDDPWVTVANPETGGETEIRLSEAKAKFIPYW